ncbi:PREDICTED: facilitated trehalose transporter Tret1-like [Nicrophorus vespilloides]|uniref:Facilitated trehalose transporter Tret1-like n=1 Tax=Nicrophorus vespilloides TaxID=110193 RepID=A0ABM1NHY7_NICVS|nr:PREDICTED: facilitated trehalose transporter Tret1-like [Nicrophorus vespilloides]
MDRKSQYRSSAIVSVGCVCAGSILAWTSPVLLQLSDVASTIQPPLTETEGGLVGSIVAIGAITSAIPSGLIADKLGLKRTLLLLSAIFAVSCLVVGSSGSLKILLFGRFLGGFASGAACVCIPMYISEIADVEIRGILGSFFQLGFCLGILGVNCIGALTTWRTLSYILTTLPVLYAVLLFTIKDPPRHQRNRSDGCSIRSVLLKENYKPLLVSLGLVAFQQLSGINAIIFYTSPIFSASKSNLSPQVSSIIVAAVQLVFSIISASIIEKFKRTFYLSVSGSLMFVSLLVLGSYFHFHEILADFSFIPLISLIVFIIAYCVGFGPLPWLMLAEMFQPSFKSTGCGIATMFNWTMVFAVTAAFPLVRNKYGDNFTFYLFAAFNLFAVLFTMSYVPETRGKTSDEIRNCFVGPDVDYEMNIEGKHHHKAESRRF